MIIFSPSGIGQPLNSRVSQPFNLKLPLLSFRTLFNKRSKRPFFDFVILFAGAFWSFLIFLGLNRALEEKCLEQTLFVIGVFQKSLGVRLMDSSSKKEDPSLLRPRFFEDSVSVPKGCLCPRTNRTIDQSSHFYSRESRIDSESPKAHNSQLFCLIS